MSKMLHEYIFDMQLFKNPEFGWVENNPFYWRDELLSFILEFKQNLKKSLFLVKNRVFVKKINF